MDYHIREIETKDDPAVEKIIRNCLIEFGADHAGTAWTDPELGHFSTLYSTIGNRYWVAVDAEKQVVGGVGIGTLDKLGSICELQKMYCIPTARGCGIARALLEVALTYARQYYKICYLETLENMTVARRFYEKNGFVRIEAPLVQTEHFACDVRYSKVL